MPFWLMLVHTKHGNKNKQVSHIQLKNWTCGFRRDDAVLHKNILQIPETMMGENNALAEGRVSRYHHISSSSYR